MKSKYKIDGKKVTIREKRKGLMFFKKHWLDFLFIVIFLFFFGLGIHFRFQEVCTCFFHNHYDLDISQYISPDSNIIEFVTILIPVLVTIVTIGISIPETEIFGIPYSDFRRIRGDYEYSLLWMILISVLILLFAIASNILKFFWTAIALNIMSLVYCIIFMCKEIPILTKKDNFLFKLVRNSNDASYRNDHPKKKRKSQKTTGMRNSKKTKQNSSYYNKRTLCLVDIKTYLLFYYGINKTYRILYKNEHKEDEYDEKLLSDLLYLQTDYLKGLYQNYYVLKDFGGGKYRNTDINVAISMSVKNASEILQNIDGLCLVDILRKSSNLLSLTDMINTLYKVLDKLGVYDCYDEQFEDIVNKLRPKSINNGHDNSDESRKEQEKFNAQVSMCLALSSLDNNNLWYFDCIKNIQKKIDNYYEYRKTDEVFLLFLSLCLYYESSKKNNNQPSRDIKKFYDDDWKRLIKGILSSYKKKSFDEKLFLLKSLLSLHYSIYEPYTSHYTLGDLVHDDIAMSLDVDYIFYWWINLLYSKETKTCENKKAINDTLDEYKEKNPSLVKSNNFSRKTFDAYYKLYGVSALTTSEKNLKATSDSNADVKESDEDSNSKTIDKSYDDEEIKNFINSQIEKMTEYFKKSENKEENDESNPSTGGEPYNFKKIDKEEVMKLFDVANGVNVYAEGLCDSILACMGDVNSSIEHINFSQINKETFSDKLNSDDKAYVVLPKSVFFNKDEKANWINKLKISNIKVCNICWPANFGLVFTKDTIEFDSTISDYKCTRIPKKDIEPFVNLRCRLNNGMYQYSTMYRTRIYYSKSALINDIQNLIVDVDFKVKYQFNLIDVSKTFIINLDKTSQK